MSRFRLSLEAQQDLKDIQTYMVDASGTRLTARQSEGREAQGRVKIVALAPEGTFTGIGTSTDIVEASAKAYMDVVNKICRMRKYAPRLRGKRAKAVL